MNCTALMERTEKEALNGVSGKQAFDKNEAMMSLIIIRTDLTLPQQMVQACHASSMAGHHFDGWADDTRMALLGAKDLDTLGDAAMKLSKSGIAFYEFFEPDHSIGISAIASAPMPWKIASRALRHLPLWGSGCHIEKHDAPTA